MCERLTRKYGDGPIQDILTKEVQIRDYFYKVPGRQGTGYDSYISGLKDRIVSFERLTQQCTVKDRITSDKIKKYV